MSLELAELKAAVPKNHRAKITPEFLAEFNKLVENPDYGELYGKNLISFSSVLIEGKFKLTDYFNAVAFVSHRMLGSSSLEAYGKVFPQKIQRLMNNGTSVKDMHTYASVYNKGKLVTLVYEQTLMPDHLVFASIRHKAIATQASLLDHENPHVAQKAADSLLNHLKAPESAKMTIDIGTKDGGVIADLANALNNLSNQQRGMIIDGSFSAKDVAHAPLTITSNGDEDE